MMKFRGIMGGQDNVTTTTTTNTTDDHNTPSGFFQNPRANIHICKGFRFFSSDRHHLVQFEINLKFLIPSAQLIQIKSDNPIDA